MVSNLQIKEMSPRKENLSLHWSYTATVGSGLKDRHVYSHSQFIGVNAGVTIPCNTLPSGPDKPNVVMIILEGLLDGSVGSVSDA